MIRDILFSRNCAACGDWLSAQALGLCWSCFCELPVIKPPYCEVCGDPVEGDVTHSYRCHTCSSHAPEFDRARSVFRYREPVRSIIHGLKYSRCFEALDLLVSGLMSALETHFGGQRFDAVAGVPLVHRRERERTFNQAHLLAGRLGLSLGIERAPRRALVRTRDTGSQTGLNAVQRRANVGGAFGSEAVQWVQGRRFLLIDDVMTTGATVNACAAALVAAGAVSVHVLTVARGG